MTPAQRPTSRRERRNKVFNQMLFTRGRAQEEAQQEEVFWNFYRSGRDRDGRETAKRTPKKKLAYRDITK